MIHFRKWHWFGGIIWLLTCWQPNIWGQKQSDTPSQTQWLVAGGKVRPINEATTIQEFIPLGNDLALAMRPFSLDSTHSILQLEMELKLRRWQKDTSSLYLFVGTDSVNVLQLWAAGYNAHFHQLEGGPIKISQQGKAMIFVQKQKRVTLVPLQKKIYIKWVITPKNSLVEINGVPLSLPQTLLPWHITYVGVAIQKCTVELGPLKIIRKP